MTYTEKQAAKENGGRPSHEGRGLKRASVAMRVTSRLVAPRMRGVG